MQYHLGVLRMLLFASFLVEMIGIVTGTRRSSPTTIRTKGKAEMIKTLESRLLKIFSMKERPRPSGQAPVPEFMVELYRAQNLVQVDDKYEKPASMDRALATHQKHQGRSVHSTTANTVRSFVAQPVAESSQREVSYDAKETHLWFNITSLPAEELLRAVELRVFRTRRRSGCQVVRAQTSSEDPDGRNNKKLDRTSHRRVGSARVVYLQAYDVIRPSIQLKRPVLSNTTLLEYVETEPLLRLIDTRAIEQDHDGWESLDVSLAVRRWRNKPNDNHGLILRLVASDNGKRLNFKSRPRRCVPSVSDSKSPEDRKPILVIYSDDDRDSSLLRSARAKRNVRKPKRRKRPACRRQSLYVDFNDVGWNDWIVAPPGYNAYFCQGDCNFPLADNSNTTNHAIVQTLVNSANPSLVPRACCVPTELSPISMLYRDEYDKVVLKNYQDMVVEGCGCR